MTKPIHTIHLEKDTYEAIRLEAFKLHSTQREILNRIVREYFLKHKVQRPS